MVYLNDDPHTFGVFVELQRLEAIKPILITSVLSGKQRGLVIQNKEKNPTSGFVLHDFGWAQLLGRPDKRFLGELNALLFSNQNKLGLKRLGIFSPVPNSMLEQVCEKHERVRLTFTERLMCTPEDSQEFRLLNISPQNAMDVSSELNLDLSSRNWPDMQTFFSESFGCFISWGETPVAACYGAAKANGEVEVDIVTKQEFRGRGLGSWVANGFLDQCDQKDLVPSWDCFVNNFHSLNLAKNLGFKISSKRYIFYRFKPEGKL